MTNTKMNFKGMYTDTLCVGCFEEEETTEHLFRCKKYKELTRHKLSLNENCDEFNSTEWLVEATKLIETVEDIRSMRQRIEEK